jgi:hypothetical protein
VEEVAVEWGVGVGGVGGCVVQYRGQYRTVVAVVWRWRSSGGGSIPFSIASWFQSNRYLFSSTMYKEKKTANNASELGTGRKKKRATVRLDANPNPNHGMPTCLDEWVVL